MITIEKDIEILKRMTDIEDNIKIIKKEQIKNIKEKLPKEVSEFILYENVDKIFLINENFKFDFKVVLEKVNDTDFLSFYILGEDDIILEEGEFEEDSIFIYDDFIYILPSFYDEGRVSYYLIILDKNYDKTFNKILINAKESR